MQPNQRALTENVESETGGVVGVGFMNHAVTEVTR